MSDIASLHSVEDFATAKEDYYFDRKSARKEPKEIARHLSAFANASGGKLVIGIEDNGELSGFKRDKAHKIEEFEQAHVVGCVPSPHVSLKRHDMVNSKGEDDVILEIDINPSVDHVVKRSSDGAVFLRQDGSSKELSHEQILALEYDKNQRSYEDEIVKLSSFSDVDLNALQAYKNKLNADNCSDRQILESRGFLVNGKLTNAGVLLFAQNPTRFIPSARVRFLRFDGTEMGTGKDLNIIKDQTFEGPLARVIDGIQAAVRSQLREFQFLNHEGVFVAVPEYPEFAWLEGIVNAVTHRNYAIAGDYIRVSMFDDRLEILSPGKLPNIVTVDNMLYTRYSRNPKIARVLAEMGWVRELNEGVKRIYKEMRSFYLKDPLFDEPSDISVRLILENSILTRALRGNDAFNKFLQKFEMMFGEHEIIALQYTFVNKEITTRQLAALVEKGNVYASKLLKGLVSKGILIWHGNSKNDPSQFYTLNLY